MQELLTLHVACMHACHSLQPVYSLSAAECDPASLLPYPDQQGASRYQGYTPILLAAALGRFDMLGFLRSTQGCSLDERAPDGSTVLHLLMAQGSCPAPEGDRIGGTPWEPKRGSSSLPAAQEEQVWWVAFVCSLSHFASSCLSACTCSHDCPSRHMLSCSSCNGVLHGVDWGDRAEACCHHVRKCTVQVLTMLAPVRAWVSMLWDIFDPDFQDPGFLARAIGEVCCVCSPVSWGCTHACTLAAHSQYTADHRGAKLCSIGKSMHAYSGCAVSGLRLQAGPSDLGLAVQLSRMTMAARLCM